MQRLVWIPLIVLFVFATPVGADETARAVLPTRAELTTVGVLAGWSTPWEIRRSEALVGLFDRPYTSAGDWFGDNELDQLVAKKEDSRAEFEDIPGEAMAEMAAALRQQLAELADAGVNVGEPVPDPQARFRADLFQLAREGKLTKAALMAAFDEHVQPIVGATEMVYVRMRQVNPKDIRKAKLEIRLYLRDPAWVRAHLQQLSYPPEAASEMEVAHRVRARNMAQLLLDMRGEQLEEELTELSGLGDRATPSDTARMRIIEDALEALDKLQEYPPKVSSSMPEIGDGCVVVKALSTLPKANRTGLRLAGGEVANQIDVLLRVGSAEAHVRLTTNDASLWNDQEMKPLLHLLAEKLRGYGI